MSCKEDSCAFSFKAFNPLWMWFLVVGSSDEVGSSRNRMSGEWINDFARRTLCFIPADRFLHTFF